MDCIAYKSGYKYQLQEDFSMMVPFSLKSDVQIDNYVYLKKDGELRISKSYSWDGATCFPDFSSVMRASLVHDALYQLMRENKLDIVPYRKEADKLLYDICIEDKMNPFIASSVYLVLRLFALPAAKPRSKREVEFAPKACKQI